MNATAKILIAEDDPTAQKLLSVILKNPSYELIFAANGYEAFSLAQIHEPDLVLSDVMMPEMTGYELCQVLRNHPQFSEIPIVLLTTLSDKESRMKGIDAGADDFISKPYDMDELRARVRGILRLNRFRKLLHERETSQMREKRDERRIREQASLLNQTYDAIIQLDVDENIRFWNSGAERLYGWTADEVTGQPASTLIFGPLVGRMFEIRRILHEEGRWTGELEQVNRDGVPVVVESRWSLVRDEDGNPLSTLLINTDITEKRRMERQFQRVQRMETIGMLASGVAHDLNNMLTPISLGVEMLRLGLEPDQMAGVLTMIENSVKRGSALVKQVLTFGRDGGEKSLIQPKHVLNEVLGLIRETFPKTITLNAPQPRPLRTLDVGATQLSQILLNLCVNARDAMPGGGKLTVQAENQVENGVDSVVFTVSDTGEGIPDDVLARIFDPFFTTKEAGKGTGLGLATVRGIVEKEGGTIRVETEVGGGTTFYVALPAVAEEVQPETTGFELIPEGNGELVLAVDDEISLLDMTRGVLEAHGYRVLSASSGEQALALFGEHREELALAIVDLHMPLPDGFTVIRSIRDLSPDLPVIAVSGLELSEEGRGAGMLDVNVFLAKPYSANGLLRNIAEVLKKKG
jgi:PAS domain S-box-containing protein